MPGWRLKHSSNIKLMLFQNIEVNERIEIVICIHLVVSKILESNN